MRAVVFFIVTLGFNLTSLSQIKIRPIIGVQYQIGTYNNFQSSFNEFNVSGGIEYSYFSLKVGYGFHVSNAYLDGFSADQQRKFDFMSFDFNVRFKKEKELSAILGLTANYTLRTFNEEYYIIYGHMDPYNGIPLTSHHIYKGVKQHYSLHLGLSYRMNSFEFNLYAPLSFYFVEADEHITPKTIVSRDFYLPSIGFRFGINYIF